MMSRFEMTLKDRIEYHLKYADDIAWQYEYTMYEAPVPWFELRQYIIVWRDNRKCQSCHRRFLIRELDVHHMKRWIDVDGCDYKSNLLENLITLCRSCHKRVEVDRRKFLERLERISGKSFI